MADTVDMRHTPTAKRLKQAIEPTLTSDEQTRIGRRIGSALLATGFLVVGWLYALAFPTQKEIGDLVLFAGALVAAFPIFQAAVQGFGCSACQIGAKAHGQDTDHDHAHEHAEQAAHQGHHGHMMDQLVSIAVLAALATGEYATAILVPLLMAIGHFLEERSVLGAQAAIDGLKRLRARDACRVREDGTEETVAVDDLQTGDNVLVRPGELLPADGRVIEGHSAVDQSAVTGESVPADVAPGSAVFAGTMNTSGMLRVELTQVGSGTAMGQVLETLREAEQSRAPVTQLLERYASHYTPFVLLVAVVTLVVTGQVSRAVAILVVACPCALVLSSSTAMIAALALASRYGILIKSTRFLEVLAEVRSLVLDKTGTVTLGRLEVVDFRPCDGVSAEELLESALMCAHGSRHPASQAIVREANRQSITLSDPPETVEYPGKGVEARLNSSVVRLGAANWLEVDAPLQDEIAAHVGPVVWARRNGRTLGAVLMADEPRPEAREALLRLRDLGITRTVLLTGDRPEVAEGIGEYLGIDEVRAGLLPLEKLEFVEAEAESGDPVLAVGDGVNDAPALARADVGVAMGAMGSDAAIQSADIALMTNDIGRLATAVRLSRITRKTININVAIGIGSAISMIILAALGYIGAIVGALLHNVGAVAVVLNSARLLRLELDEDGARGTDEQGDGADAETDLAQDAVEVAQ